ncbi:hypothetical protein M404DRAFT_421424 [Pisolithus tinctorius Marx 270]|uniref:Uncharacterized protein n=1 Tax=Pisolithus tinctorius Marx 270 TaxID=870435 RepID=A0A0C3PFB0_PISTI|nr:hypothetical protein M404DRAFT_421424 [Pisolithus tinctorius Marx 270]
MRMGLSRFRPGSILECTSAVTCGNSAYLRGRTCGIKEVSIDRGASSNLWKLSKPQCNEAEWNDKWGHTCPRLSIILHHRNTCCKRHPGSARMRRAS